MLTVWNVLALLHENSIILGVVLILLFYFVHYRTGISFMTIDDKTREFGCSVCEGIDCVRCNKYFEILQKAVAKLPNLKNPAIAESIRAGLVIDDCNSNMIHKQKPNIFHHKGLDSKCVWNIDNFATCNVLQLNFSVIQNEFQKIVDQNLGCWKRNTTPTGSWDVFSLVNQGIAMKENCSLCPQTMGIISSLPSVLIKNVFGNVMFSIVKPGTLITEHYGPTNIRLRCHLGLQVSADCLLHVDDQILSWENGQCIVFDDSFLHSVTHSSQPDLSRENDAEDSTTFTNCRAVLIVDLWHPDLSEDEREAIDYIFAPY